MKKQNLIFLYCWYILFICCCLIIIYFSWKQMNKIAKEYVASIYIEEKIQIDYIQIPNDFLYVNEVDSNSNSKNENDFIPFFELSENERWNTCCIVAGEAKGESYEGQWAVAQCIYQACVNDNLQPSEVKIQYQYSGWDENLEFDNPELWAQIEEIVSRVFDYGEMCVDDEILWFYAPKWMKNGVSEWHESQRFIIEIGGHRFFGKWD